MGILASKLLVAFDAAAITGAVASWGVRGLRLYAVARASLSPGALAPSALDPNLARPEEVREALESVRRSLGVNGRRAVLVLPDGVARLLLVQAPQGVRVADYARFRVSQGLPYPAEQAITGSGSAGRRRALLAAAVRRGVVREYEETAAAVGLTQERLDLAPLAALAGLQREGGTDRMLALMLGDAALCLAAFEAGGLRAFRNRRRDPSAGEAERLRDELERTLRLAGPGAAWRVRLVGTGATALARALSDLGLAAEAGWHAGGEPPAEAAEMAFLGAACP